MKYHRCFHTSSQKFPDSLYEPHRSYKYGAGFGIANLVQAAERDPLVNQFGLAERNQN